MSRTRTAPPSEQAPKQVAPGRFTSGTSGNPGGRPKVAQTWKDRCRAFLEEQGGWAQLVLCAQGDDPLPALKLMAEYAYGKPQQPIQHGGEIAVKWYGKGFPLEAM